MPREYQTRLVLDRIPHGQKLLKSLEDIADYRVGEIKTSSQAQIRQWVEQFGKDVST
jgi:hypothetical protein